MAPRRIHGAVMTPKKYYDALMALDWNFAKSDDPGVYRAGRDKMGELSSLQHKSPKHKKIWDEFWRYNTCLIRNPRLKPRRPQ
jgi:hypothetical protein